MPDVGNQHSPLVERAALSTFTLVEAPAGYGKSSFLTLLTRAVGGALWRGALDELDPAQVASTVSDGTGLVIVDSSTCHDDRATAAAIETIRRGADGLRLVVAGRHFGPTTRQLARRPGCLRIQAADLRWRADGSDLRLPALGHLGDPAQVAELLERDSAGWPLLVDEVIDWLGEGNDLVEALAPTAPPVLAVLGPAIERLDGPDRDLAAQLAMLPVLDDELIRLVAGRSALERLLDAGLPLAAEGGSVHRFPPVIREALTDGVTPSAELARAVAQPLVGRGHSLEATQLLFRACGVDEAAAFFTGLPPHLIDGLDVVDLLSLLDVLAPATADHPRLHLFLATAERDRANLAEQRRHLLAASVVETGVCAPQVRAEARVDLLYLDALVGDSSPGLRDRIAGERQRLNDLVTGEDGTCVAERCLLVLAEAEALWLSNTDRVEDLEEASLSMSRAARSWEHRGEPVRAGATLRVAAARMLIPLGRHREAEAALARSERLSAGQTIAQTRNLITRARNAALAGWGDPEGWLSRIGDLSDTTGNAWMNAYGAWSSMLNAAAERRLGAVTSFHEQAWSALGQLRQVQTGAVFLAESAVAFAHCGDIDRALRLLARLADRRSESPLEIDLAEAIVRAGVDPVGQVTDRIEQLLASGQVPPARRWRLLLTLAATLRRAGSPGAAVVLERARTEADLGGLGDGPARLHPELFDAATTPAGLGEPGSTLLTRPSSTGVSITVLGGFDVLKDGASVELPSAKASELVKLLVVRGGSAPVDLVIEALWPEISPEIGRRRLKNVVSRARTGLGDAIRRDPDRLALVSSVDTDLRQFDLAARHALLVTRGDPQAGADACLNALQLYSGELLPDDRYHDWIEAARLEVRARAIALVDLLVSGTVPQPSVELLTAGAEAALRIEPPDPDQLARLAVRCADADIPTTARSLMDRARLGYAEQGRPHIVSINHR